jgi:hypothetical protein
LYSIGDNDADIAQVKSPACRIGDGSGSGSPANPADNPGRRTALPRLPLTANQAADRLLVELDEQPSSRQFVTPGAQAEDSREFARR